MLEARVRVGVGIFSALVVVPISAEILVSLVKEPGEGTRTENPAQV